MLCVLFFIQIMNAQDSFVGIWDKGKDNTKIEMTETARGYATTIFSSDNPKAKLGGVQNLRGILLILTFRIG